MVKRSSRHRKHDRRVYAFLGFILGLGAPVGWLVWRALFNQPQWLFNEFGQFGSVYAYMTVGTLLVFTVFGYLVGRHSDDIVDQSDSIKEALEKVNLMAITDSLTKIHNARHLHDRLSIEMESAERYSSPLTCLMLDIDDFKKINDKYGHPAGDAVLASLADILRQCVRRVDIVGRLGGEEFLVIMPHTSADTGVLIAERIRQAVQRWPFKAGDAEISVSVSIGVACYPSTGLADKSDFLKATDEALYEAKRSGKNRTVLSKLNAVVSG